MEAPVPGTRARCLPPSADTCLSAGPASPYAAAPAPQRPWPGAERGQLPSAETVTSQTATASPGGDDGAVPSLLRLLTPPRLPAQLWPLSHKRPGAPGPGCRSRRVGWGPSLPLAAPLEAPQVLSSNWTVLKVLCSACTLGWVAVLAGSRPPAGVWGLGFSQPWELLAPPRARFSPPGSQMSPAVSPRSCGSPSSLEPCPLEGVCACARPCPCARPCACVRARGPSVLSERCCWLSGLHAWLSRSSRFLALVLGFVAGPVASLCCDDAL